MHPFLFDVRYLIWVAPAVILGLLAQMWVRSAYAQMRNMPSRISGFQAARAMLDAFGLQQVGIEQIPGVMSDHYDPRDKVLRLSGDVYHGRSLASVGIAAHEAGHAIQDAQRYAPLVIRNLAVPAANFGSNFGLGLLVLGIVTSLKPLLFLGIVLFSAVVVFQVINLPVEFDASARAKTELVQLGVVGPQELPYVKRVLNAAALTYVASTLQSVLTLLYYLSYLNGRDDR